MRSLVIEIHFTKPEDCINENIAEALYRQILRLDEKKPSNLHNVKNRKKQIVGYLTVTPSLNQKES